MKFPFIKHPGNTTLMTNLLVILSVAAALKFILDGVSLVINGHTITFGHSDSMSYASLLGPAYGAHGYMNRDGATDDTEPQPREVPDDVDAI